MAYCIRGLDPAQFSDLAALDDDALAARRAKRVVADADRGFPCRVTLEDAGKGERLLLVHHVHHAVDTPYRSAFAVFVREGAQRPAEFVDRCPPVFAGRQLSLRGFSDRGELEAATLVIGDEADASIRAMFADPAIAYIDAHNAAPGCFAARVERHGDEA